MDSKTVKLSKRAEKDIKKLPKNIAINLYTWIKTVGEIGLRKTRNIKGYHDEPLKGKRKNQRSVRPSKAYRALYVEHKNGTVELNFVELIEVNKHEY